MKKLFFLMSILCTFISCTNEDVTSTNDVYQEDCKTLVELKDFNQSIGSKISTRGWLNRFLDVASGDILGMAAGIAAGQKIAVFAGAVTGGTGYMVTSAVCGAICGASASHTAYRATRGTRSAEPIGVDNMKFLSIADDTYKVNLTNRKLEEFEMLDDTYVYNDAFDKIEIPKKFDYIKRVGEDHNGIVNVVLSIEKDNDYSPEVSIEKIKGAIPSLEETSENLDSLVFENPQFISSYKNIHLSINNCINENGKLDIDAFFRSNPLFSKRVEQALKDYLSLFNSYPENVDEVAEITNGYIEIIERNNEFTDDEKEIIYAAVSVALYSPQIWNDFE